MSEATFATIAQTCLQAADSGAMTFPQIVETLIRAGFESYAIDFRASTATYYRPDGITVALPAHHRATPIGDRLDQDALGTAIREAQQLVPGYTYAGFCAKAMAAGFTGYIVSFTGRRALYIGRNAETHVEPFPQ